LIDPKHKGKEMKTLKMIFNRALESDFVRLVATTISFFLSVWIWFLIAGDIGAYIGAGIGLIGLFFRHFSSLAKHGDGKSPH